MLAFLRSFMLSTLAIGGIMLAWCILSVLIYAFPLATTGVLASLVACWLCCRDEGDDDDDA